MWQFLLILVLLVLMLAALPAWPHSRQWGFSPSAVLAGLASAAVVLLFFGII